MRTSDLSYGRLPRQTLDIYKPCSAVRRASVVIFFYGGDWQTGSKADYRFVAHALTSRGFVAVLPDYRLYPQVRFPLFVEDGALAVRWVYDNISRFGGDPNHIYLMGHSAGAHIAALLSLDDHYLKAVRLDRNVIRATAALSGPYNFVPSPDDLPVFGMRPGDTSRDPRIEPIHFVDGHEPPMLLLQGAKDKIVDPDNATELAARIRQMNGEVCEIIYPDRAHRGVVMAFASSFQWLAPVLRDTTNFYRRH